MGFLAQSVSQGSSHGGAQGCSHLKAWQWEGLLLSSLTALSCFRRSTSKLTTLLLTGCRSLSAAGQRHQFLAPWASPWCISWHNNWLSSEQERKRVKENEQNVT